MGSQDTDDLQPHYGADLSFIHDAGFTELAGAGADLALQLRKTAPPGPVFEIGCGGGVTAAMVDAPGREIIGIDLSPAQIELAQKRVPAGEFRVGSFIDAELPPAPAAILALGEIVNYGFDGRSGLEALAEFAPSLDVFVAHIPSPG